MNALSRQIEELIANVVMPMEASGGQIDPEVVANKVERLIDPEHLAPELKTHTSILQLRQSARAYLRTRHDPVVRANNPDQNLSLFDDELQPYYPVRQGKEKPLYIPRDQLTMRQREANAKRMRLGGRTLLSHADALIAEGLAQLEPA